MTITQKMHLRHDVWFSLSTKQQRVLTAQGIYANNLYDCPVKLFVNVTRSKKLYAKMIKLWENNLKAVA